MIVQLKYEKGRYAIKYLSKIITNAKNFNGKINDDEWDEH